MTFIHFGLLAFAPIIAAPIILHLLTLHKLRTIELSTYRFLFDGEVRSRRRFQFEDILLAILRTLFLLLIVMALARPTVSRWGALFGGMASGRDVVLLIDASASMSVTTDGRSAMQQAKQAANSIVENLPKQDRVTVIRVASRPEEVCSRFASNPDAIRKSIDQLEAGPARANWFAALLHTFQSDRLANPSVYVISDMQSTGWRELKSGEASSLVPDDTELFVINVGSSQPIENHGIVAGVHDDQHVLAGLPVTLRPRVVNFSKSESAEVPISVFSGDEEVARKTITVEPGQAAEAELVYTPEASGIQRLRYEIPDDRFAADNVYRFALAASSEVKVVLINGHPSSDPLEDRGLFLRSALTVEEDQVQSIHIQEVRQSQLRSEHIRDADVVILADCGELSAAGHRALRAFVSDGGGLLILPGEQVDPREYNQHLIANTSHEDRDLLNVRIEAATGSTNEPASYDRVGGVDFAHPVFSVFRDPDKHYLAETRTYRRFHISPNQRSGGESGDSLRSTPATPQQAAHNTWTLARFADGSPMIVEGRFVKGRVLLSAIPFDATWSNLALQPEFVPLVLRMVAHVKRRPDANVATVVPAEGVAEVFVDASWEPVQGTVVAKVVKTFGEPHHDPKLLTSFATNESHNPRAPTALEFKQDNNHLVAAFDKTHAAAFYEVSVAGGSTWDAKEATLAFAINTAADESHFDIMTHRDLSGMLPDVELTMIDASPEAQQRHGQVGAKRELWRTLIFLAAAVIAIELLIATPSGSPVHSDLASRFSLTQLFTGIRRAGDVSPRMESQRRSNQGTNVLRSPKHSSQQPITTTRP